MKYLTGIFALLAVLAAIGPAQAVAEVTNQPFIDPLFADHMVLQRGISDPVWGWSTPGDVVTVSINGFMVKARANSSGEWVANLPSMSAGGPYSLKASGRQTVTFQDVLVGDVWLCSGQSNMEFGIGNGLNADAEIAAADYPSIRLFTVPKQTSISPLPSTGGQWQVCTPTAIRQQGTWGGFSAVGYFFGRDLYEKLNIPIGLIQSSWGGDVGGGVDEPKDASC